MGEACNGTCVMEPRFQELTNRLNEQSKQYMGDRVESAVQMAEMKKDIKSILQIQSDMNRTLNKVLEDNQCQKLEKAASQNEDPAGKWKSLSSGAKVLIVAGLTAAVTYIVTHILTSLIK